MIDLSNKLLEEKMETLQEIKVAVEKLSQEEFSRFRDWLNNFEADVWDRKFEKDVRAGKLDSLAKQAISDFKNGNCRKL